MTDTRRPGLLQDPAEGARRPDPMKRGPDRPSDPAEGARVSADAQALPLRSGMIAAGGRGGEGDELLIDGQEEVFSRAEVESGRIEHQSTAGSGRGSSPGEDDEPPGD